jgi:CRISPR/Cas system CSM-associated protein Csm3 (group 7 of RAMP superfamily)
VKFRIEPVVILDSPVVIGGAGDTVGVDRGFEVDWMGRPVIPGSSFRGRTRATLESLAKPIGFRVCGPPNPEGLCKPNLAVDDPMLEACIGCRIFGNAWLPSPIVVTDFTATTMYSKDEDYQLAIAPSGIARTHVGISRQTGTAAQGRLYSIAVPVMVTDAGELCYAGTISGDLPEAELGMLLLAVKSIRAIGGGKNRGLGSVTVNITTLELEDAPCLRGAEADEKAMCLAEAALLGRCGD